MRSSDKIAFGDRPTCTIRQAAEATGLGRTTIYTRIADGQLVTQKVGRRRLINVESLLALVGADRDRTI
jgi:excisionase family DNA binding protein